LKHATIPPSNKASNKKYKKKKIQRGAERAIPVYDKKKPNNRLSY
jgi:hypothetical protein